MTAINEIPESEDDSIVVKSLSDRCTSGSWVLQCSAVKVQCSESMAYIRLRAC
jgi:hypothetical protein